MVLFNPTFCLNLRFASSSLTRLPTSYEVERRRRKADVPTEPIQGFAAEGMALTVIILDVDIVMISILYALCNDTHAHVMSDVRICEKMEFEHDSDKS